jgi:hypothetical protein
MVKLEQAYREALYNHNRERVGKNIWDEMKTGRNVLSTLRDEWRSRKSSTEHLEQLKTQADAAAERYRERLLDQIEDRMAGRVVPTALTADSEGIKVGLQNKLVGKTFELDQLVLDEARAEIAKEKALERAALKQKWEKSAAVAERLAKLLPKNPKARLVLGLFAASATGATVGVLAVGAATGVATLGAAAGVGALAGAGRWGAATALGIGAGAAVSSYEGKRVQRAEDKLRSVLADATEANTLPIAKARQAARLANAQVDSAKLRRTVLPKVAALTAALGSRGLMGVYDVLSPATAAVENAADIAEAIEPAASAAETAVDGFDEAFGGVPYARIPGSGLIEGLRSPTGAPLPNVEVSNMALVAERGDGLPVDVYEQAKIRGVYWLAVKDYYKPNIPIDKLEKLVFERLENKFSGEAWWQKAGVKEFRILGGIKEATPLTVESAASAASGATSNIETTPIQPAAPVGAEVAPPPVAPTIPRESPTPSIEPRPESPRAMSGIETTATAIESSPVSAISPDTSETSTATAEAQVITNESSQEVGGVKSDMTIQFAADAEPPSYSKTVAIGKINEYVPDAKDVSVTVSQGTMKVAGINKPTTVVNLRVTTTEGQVLETQAVGNGTITDKSALGNLLIKATDDLPGARPAIVGDVQPIERPGTGKIAVASEDPLGDLIQTLDIENKSVPTPAELAAIPVDTPSAAAPTSVEQLPDTVDRVASMRSERQTIPLPPTENIPSGKYLESDAYQKYLRENGISMDRLAAQVKATVAGFEGKTYTGLWDEMRHRSPYQELGRMTVGEIENLRKSMWDNEPAIREYASKNGFKYDTLMKWANQMDYMKQDTTIPVNPNTTMEDWIHRFIAKMMIEKQVAPGQTVDLPTPPRGVYATGTEVPPSRPNITEVATQAESAVDTRINRMVRSIEKGNPLLDNEKYESSYKVLSAMKTSDVEAIRVAARSNPTALYEFAQKHNVSLTLVRKWMLKVDTMIGTRPLPGGTTFANWLSTQIANDMAAAKQIHQVTASWSPRR